MRNKILFLVLTALVVNVACPICGGGDNLFDVFEIRGYLSTVDEYNPLSESDAINGISSEQLKLTISVNYNTFSQVMPIRSPFITSAYACSPPYPEPIQEILSIHVYSNADFTMGSTNYPAGTALDELFTINNGYYYNTDFEPLAGFNAKGNVASSIEPWELQLAQPVDAEQTHQFKIVYTHTDGELEEVFEETLFPVKILP